MMLLNCPDKIQPTMSFVKVIFLGIRIIVPILLILIASLDTFKALSAKDDTAIKNAITALVKKGIAAIMIFFIFPITLLILRITTEDESTIGQFVYCMEHETSWKYAAAKSPRQKNGVIVQLTSENSEADAYLITKNSTTPTGNELEWIKATNNSVEVAKYPGQYYVFSKDSNNVITNVGKITVDPSALYDFGAKSRDKTSLLKTPLPDFLASKGDSIENYNKFIADSVLSAGLFTREGVVAAAIAATNYLYLKYNVQIPYWSNTSCASTRYYKKFGSNPDWGAPITKDLAECAGGFIGLDCASFVGWAIHNGGFKAYNTVGSYGRKSELCAIYSPVSKKCAELRSKEDMYSLYKTAEQGDIIYNPAHVMLVIDQYEGGIYIMEAFSSVGIKSYDYSELYKDKYYGIVSNDSYYKDSENYACTGGNVTIPESWESQSSKFTNQDC